VETKGDLVGLILSYQRDSHTRDTAGCFGLSSRRDLQFTLRTTYLTQTTTLSLLFPLPLPPCTIPEGDLTIVSDLTFGTS
jgi:hypothetical protein